MDEMGGQHDGALLVEHDMAVHGLVTGSAFVLGGATLHLHGLVQGDLIAEPGSIVIVHGTVQGAIINRGGDVSVFGMAGSVSGTHPSHIHDGALIAS